MDCDLAAQQDTGTRQAVIGQVWSQPFLNSPFLPPTPQESNHMIHIIHIYRTVFRFLASPNSNSGAESVVRVCQRGRQQKATLFWPGDNWWKRMSFYFIVIVVIIIITIIITIIFYILKKIHLEFLACTKCVN